MNVNTAATAPLMRQTQNTSLTGPVMQSHQILLLLFVLLLSHYDYCKEIQLSFIINKPLLAIDAQSGL